jgi:twitching motility protein PilI
MAKDSQLRDYQSSILARLEEAKKKGAETAAGYLGVVIGDRNVLVNLQEISETMPVEEIQAVPLVKSWFLGVANVRGVLYAINDLSQMIGQKMTTVSSNARLLLMSDAVASHVAFVVEKMIGLRRLDEMTVVKDRPQANSLQEELASICLRPEVYLDAENRVWHVLDCRQLVQSKEFAVPYSV